MSDKSPTSSPPQSEYSEENSPTTLTAPHTSRSNPVNTATTAAIAAALDATRVHQTLLPGLATLFFEGGSSIASKYSSLTDSIDKKAFDAANFLPSVEVVTTAALKSINDFPPYVTMNIRDSAPQLTLEDVIPNDNETNTVYDGIDFSKTVRRLVVRGGMGGYRMSRASHGVSSGCYYYEAIVLGSKSGVGLKRPREKLETTSSKTSDNGHLRLGWSTRLGDLQAPVGYDKHSYAIRDIMGSRIHNSRREDKWGGMAFGPGDVIGFAICLNDKTVDDSADNTNKSEPTKRTNQIYVYKNGVLMGNQDSLKGKQKPAAFENIVRDTYFPAVSCYLDGSAQLNFGPYFVYTPGTLPNDLTPMPISELCSTPLTPEETEETIISSSKEGRKLFLSKRTDDVIVTAFKQLVRTEATVRREAYSHHLRMHRNEILSMRNERGLATLDVLGNN